MLRAPFKGRRDGAPAHSSAAGWFRQVSLSDPPPPQFLARATADWPETATTIPPHSHAARPCFHPLALMPLLPPPCFHTLLSWACIYADGLLILYQQVSTKVSAQGLAPRSRPKVSGQCIGPVNRPANSPNEPPFPAFARARPPRPSQPAFPAKPRRKSNCTAMQFTQGNPHHTSPQAVQNHASNAQYLFVLPAEDPAPKGVLPFADCFLCTQQKFTCLIYCLLTIIMTIHLF